MHDRAPMGSITSKSPLELVCIDLHLDACQGGFDCISILMDQFTRFAWAWATHNKVGKTAAECLGSPGLATQPNSTPYHPRGNLVEKLNRTLLQMLRTLGEKEKENCEHHLPHVSTCTTVLSTKQQASPLTTCCMVVTPTSLLTSSLAS